MTIDYEELKDERKWKKNKKIQKKHYCHLVGWLFFTGLWVSNSGYLMCIMFTQISTFIVDNGSQVSVAEGIYKYYGKWEN